LRSKTYQRGDGYKDPDPWIEEKLKITPIHTRSPIPYACLAGKDRENILFASPIRNLLEQEDQRIEWEPNPESREEYFSKKTIHNK
jgi:hypothetical protein